MKARRVALLRGINVGQAKRVTMADLRALLEGLGHEDVKTVLNSGNVVYSSDSTSAADDASRIEAAVAATLGVRTRVTALDGQDIVKAVEENPFASVADNPSRLLLMVLRDETVGTKLTPLLNRQWAPEAFAFTRRVVYLWCPNGILNGQLWSAADRLVRDDGTARNLATMGRIVASVKGP